MTDAAARLAAIIGHGEQGASLAKKLAREGVRTRADLKQPSVLARLPLESRANVVYAPRRATRAAAAAIAAEVVRHLDVRGEVIPVGSVRRRAAAVHDFDFLVVVPEHSQDTTLASMSLRGGDIHFGMTYAAGAKRRGVILCGPRGNYRADFFITTEAAKPFALFHYTGSSLYNIRTRAHVKRQGQLLNQYGLFDSAGKHVRGTAAIKTERDLARFIGVSYRAPHDREK